MKKLLAIIAAGAFTAGLICACSDDNKTTWEAYKEWREQNEKWLADMQAKKNPDGTPYYEVVIPSWDPGTYVLMHYLNDRTLTEGNLSPLYSSTIDTRYTLHLCDGTGVDSSYSQVTYGPGIYRTRLSSVVQGWAVALTQMRCGDTADIIIPYNLGYGSSETGTIAPYSNLRFGIRLVDIPYYEATPY